MNFIDERVTTWQTEGMITYIYVLGKMGNVYENDRIKASKYQCGEKGLNAWNGEIKESGGSSGGSYIFSLFFYKQTQTLLARRRGQIMDEIERTRELIPRENTVNYSWPPATCHSIYKIQLQ
jgi:hypothetical protein